MLKRIAIGIGLSAWALGSATLIGVGVYGLTHENKATAVVITNHVAEVSATVETQPEPVLVVTPTVEYTPAPVATDNTSCGCGCVRASFTVVN